MADRYADFVELTGQTILEVIEDDMYDYTITFKTKEGNTYTMGHDQDCCEYVNLEDVAGGVLSDLVGQEVVLAYETTEDDKQEHGDEVSMWTFYTIRTPLHTLTLRWYGSSNGYYSVDVSFKQILE